MSDSVDLTKAYQEAGAAVLRSLHGDDVHTVRLRFEKTLQTVVTHLDVLQSNALTSAVSLGRNESQTSLRRTLSSIFNGRAFTMKDLEAKGLYPGNKRAVEAVLEHKQSDARKTATYRHNYLELRSGLVGVSEELKNKVNKALGELAEGAGNTVRAATDELIADLQQNGVFSIKYNNGASVGVDKYAAMVCRSARAESANAENVRLADAFGTDLVECVGNAVTCEVCAKYRGRVFSVSGKDKRFPPLRDGPNSPLRNGYDVIHPNCRCQFVPYFEKFHSDDDNRQKQTFSTRPFEGDPRSEKQKEAYQRWQALNRRASDERHEFEEMTRAYKSANLEPPYKTLGAFRRAHRADKESTGYARSHYWRRELKTSTRRELIKKLLSKSRKDETINISCEGTKLTIASGHFIERISERNVSIDSIVDTVFNPLKIGSIKIDREGRPSQAIIGEKITIYVNPETGKLITTHPTHTRIVKKIKGGNDV